VTLVDTALAYSIGNEDSYAERLLATALQSVGGGERPMVATKGGHFRRGDDFVVDGRPETIRANCERSLHALRVESIDLYLLHKPDPSVPLAESVGALADLKDTGKVRRVGLSNISVSELATARTVVEIAAVQNRLDSSGRDPVIEQCEALGIGYLGYGPFGGTPGAIALTSPIAEIAGARGVSPQRVTIARHLHSSPMITVVVGARRPATIRDSAAAAGLVLSPREVELLKAV
jgi:aryl-alcohol dehydrogenase-like predicted oxidoreductase